MEFEWDESKRRQNLRKHGLDFADAHYLFDGPMLTRLDTREQYPEPRWIGIGFIRTICAVLAFTEREEGQIIRVISFRKALTHERKAFEKAIQDQLGSR